MSSSTDTSYFKRLVDREALRSYLTSELGPPESETFEITHLGEGHSNETLFVTWGNRELVMRRPPPGETAESAHDVLREYRILSALRDTDIPLPNPVLACEDHDVIGSDFYVMNRLEGDVIRDTEPDRFATPDARRRIGKELIDILTRIHAVDYKAVGLEELGKPEGFTRRQVSTWTRQWQWASEATFSVREIPQLEEVKVWLEENVPSDHPKTLFHGDYKLDNVMFEPGTPPRINGVFDWEMGTLGDPLVDLGWMLISWRDDEENATDAGIASTDFMSRRGYPTRRELVDLYESATGIEFTNPRFYLALAVYKHAGVGEMFFARHLRGDADDELYPTMEEVVPNLADRALRIIEGDGSEIL